MTEAMCVSRRRTAGKASGVVGLRRQATAPGQISAFVESAMGFPVHSLT